MMTERLARLLEGPHPRLAHLLSAHRAEISETRPPFLRAATAVSVVVLHPKHPITLSLVISDEDAVFNIGASADEIERMRRELGVMITSPNAALHYVEWILDLTQGSAFWRVSKLDDVPFFATSDPENAADVERAKQAIGSKIAPPTSTQDGNRFVVTQLAVRGRSLLRYRVEVDREGQVDVRTENVAAELPVVYVYP